MGREACGDEGSAFLLESDVGGCSAMLLDRNLICYGCLAGDRFLHGGTIQSVLTEP